MIAALRILSSLLLTLVLTLTAQTMALAHGQTSVAGQMVLCVGTGVVTVQIDTGGNPVEPAHICPDCALTFLMAVDASLDSARPVFVPVSVCFWQSPAASGGESRVSANARGPPAGCSGTTA